MSDPNFILLYVDNPLASARFYSQLLERPPIEAQATFVMFALDSGVMLGLWSRHTAEPAPSGNVGGGELAFSVASKELVNAMYAQWCGRELRIAQKPVQMDFGYTFVALDPDGHRLRVFAASEE